MIKPKIKKMPFIPKNALLVGNSFSYYNNGVGACAEAICREKGDPIAFTMVTISEAGLGWHLLKSYLRPDGIKSWSFATDGSNKIVKNEYTDGRIFDAVILQGNSQEPIHPELAKGFTMEAAEDCRTIREAGAFPLLVMTWAYKDKPEMMEALAQATLETANTNDALVVPAGLAFARSIGLNPDLPLHTTDKRHPTPAGTYLYACVIFSTLTAKSPAGARCRGIGEAMIDEDDAKFLQKVAWDTVCSFFG